jgi:hypothetical protein
MLLKASSPNLRPTRLAGVKWGVLLGEIGPGLIGVSSLYSRYCSAVEDGSSRPLDALVSRYFHLPCHVGAPGQRRSYSLRPARGHRF